MGRVGVCRVRVHGCVVVGGGGVGHIGLALGGGGGGGDEKEGGNCGREPPNTSHGNDSATPPATGQDRQRCRNKERSMSSPHPTPDQIHAGRLARLRAVLKARGLDGFVLPISDEHIRSAEQRGGKEAVRTCRSRGTAENEK